LLSLANIFFFFSFFSLLFPHSYSSFFSSSPCFYCNFMPSPHAFLGD
jgi:hypothetical protein